MDLVRGVCTLCSENCRVVPAEHAEQFTKFLPKILYNKFLIESDFQKIKDSIKICPICCYKLEIANKVRTAINTGLSATTEKTSRQACRFCNSNERVTKVKDNWQYLLARVEGFIKVTELPVLICNPCFFYFDTIFNFKTKLIRKFPQLAVPTKAGKSPGKQNETPKRKSQSKSPSSTKKRKIFDDCFTYLQPLCNSNYRVAEKLKKDKRLYRKIAYVNLKEAQNVKETPKKRPVIKIKLKNKPKEEEEKTDELLDDDGNELFTTQPLIKPGRSEEVAKNEDQKSKSKKTAEETLEETPKAASTTNPVPKRRVSLFVETNEAETDKDNQSDSSEEINKMINKYRNCTFDDSGDLLKDVGEKELDVKIEENGFEKATDETAEDAVATETEDKEAEKIEEDKSETKSEDNTPESEEEKLDTSKSESSTTLLTDPSSRSSPLKSDCSSNEGSDSDESDKSKNKDADRDSLNGSEKKKKRVTFSDEIN